MAFEPQRLASGATADLFTWEGGQVLKLLHKGRPPEQIMREARWTHAAHEAKLPAPAVGERADFGERHGWLFEYIEGPLLETHLMQTGDTDHAAQVMSRLHAQLHGTLTTALPDLRLHMRRKIEAAPLNAALSQRALTLLEHLPDGDSFCHGDLHPGNIIMSAAGPILIDWNDAHRGHALADVARTLVLLGGWAHEAAIADHYHEYDITTTLMQAYLEAYCTLTRASREAIMPWVVPVAAARLAEGHPALRGYLTRLAAGEPLLND